MAPRKAKVVDEENDEMNRPEKEDFRSDENDPYEENDSDDDIVSDSDVSEDEKPKKKEKKAAKATTSKAAPKKRSSKASEAAHPKTKIPKSASQFGTPKKLGGIVIPDTFKSSTPIRIGLSKNVRVASLHATNN